MRETGVFVEGPAQAAYGKNQKQLYSLLEQCTGILRFLSD